jgi:DNA-binding GntR family transcriptional regulator
VISVADEIDKLSYTPYYVQLADILAAKIERGDLEPGDPVPSESYLQQQYGLARGTVRTAIKLLNERSLARTIQGRGTYVLPRPDKPEK